MRYTVSNLVRTITYILFRSSADIKNKIKFNIIIIVINNNIVPDELAIVSASLSYNLRKSFGKTS